MKLVRYGDRGRERRGLIDQQSRIGDLSAHIANVSALWVKESDRKGLARVNEDDLPTIASNPRLGACVAGMRNSIAVGLNCAEHAGEAGAARPRRAVDERQRMPRVRTVCSLACDARRDPRRTSVGFVAKRQRAANTNREHASNEFLACDTSFLYFTIYAA
jgi:hypothetical protein